MIRIGEMDRQILTDGLVIQVLILSCMEFIFVAVAGVPAECCRLPYCFCLILLLLPSMCSYSLCCFCNPLIPMVSLLYIVSLPCILLPASLQLQASLLPSLLCWWSCCCVVVIPAVACTPAVAAILVVYCCWCHAVACNPAIPFRS
jgi:hypothetical protein